MITIQGLKLWIRRTHFISASTLVFSGWERLDCRHGQYNWRDVTGVYTVDARKHSVRHAQKKRPGRPERPKEKQNIYTHVRSSQVYNLKKNVMASRVLGTGAPTWGRSACLRRTKWHHAAAKKTTVYGSYIGEVKEEGLEHAVVGVIAAYFYRFGGCADMSAAVVVHTGRN